MLVVLVVAVVSGSAGCAGVVVSGGAGRDG